MSPQTITRLEVSNVKRLRAVTINPAGNLVVIGGDNANGKTSVLDSIAMAIGGKSAVPERPIREGQTRASIVLETEELIVERTFTANSGSSLVVKKKDGSRLSSPQEVLNALTSKVAFDPLEFIHLDPKKQAETLRALAGIDFAALDEQRKAAYDTRTTLNAKVKELEALLKQAPFDATLAAEEISVTRLAQKLQALNVRQNGNDRLREQLPTANDRVDSAADDVLNAESALKLAEKSLADARALHARAIEQRDALKATIAELVDPESGAAMQEMQQAEETNRRIRANLAAKASNEALFTHAKLAKARTEEIEKIDAEKARQLEAARLPVPELSFDETGVVYRGMPFAQASAAEQLRVSMGVAMALNPTLKVCLIRDGSLLDDKNLALVAEMAAAQGGQVWLERVGHGEEVSVVIEDGQVASVRQPKKATKPEAAVAAA